MSNNWLLKSASRFDGKWRRLLTYSRSNHFVLDIRLSSNRSACGSFDTLTTVLFLTLSRTDSSRAIGLLDFRFGVSCRRHKRPPRLNFQVEGIDKVPLRPCV